MCEEPCSHGRMNRRESSISLCTVSSVPEETVMHFCGEKQTGYCTDTIQCNAVQCNENSQFHYRGSAFVAYVLYGSLGKMT